MTETQTQSRSFELTESGKPESVTNDLAASSSISVNYRLHNSPSAMSLVVVGGFNNGAQQVVLDTYSGTTDTTRTVNFSQTYDYFQVVGTWTGANVRVFVTIQSTGPGPSFNPGYYYGPAQS
jgi:hypothetical protein